MKLITLAKLKPSSRCILTNSSYTLIGEEPVECLKCDLQVEIKAIPDLKKAIEHCEKVSDFVSRNIFREILDSEEEHYDWLETQIQLANQLGKENWLQSQL